MVLYGKKSALEKIEGFFEAGRFPHAILLYGEMGLGKSTLAVYLAQLICCENPTSAKPCGECPSCYKIQQGVHPDIVFAKQMDGSGKYRVETLRKLVNVSALRPNDADVRVIIFDDIDTMLASSQNTLLKFVEEPEEYNRFIFTANSQQGVLPTILSRVTAVELARPSAEQCILALVENGIDKATAQQLVQTHGSNIGACMNASEMTAETALARQIAQSLAEREEFSTAVGFASANTRESMESLLGLLTEIFRDSIFYKNGGKTFVGCDRQGAQQLAKKYSEKNLARAIKELDKCRTQFEFNPNLSLAGAVYSARIFSVLSS